MHVILHDVHVTKPQNLRIKCHLSYKSTSFAKTSVPIHTKKSANELKEVTLPFSRLRSDIFMTFRYEVTSMSCDFETEADEMAGRSNFGSPVFVETVS